MLAPYIEHPEHVNSLVGAAKMRPLKGQRLEAALEDRVSLGAELSSHLYRQDFNIDPLEYWRGANAPERQGITEIRHVTGYLAYWDELRRRHPQMLIDSCASGGRRNDVQTMRRVVVAE